MSTGASSRTRVRRGGATTVCVLACAAVAGGCGGHDADGHRDLTASSRAAPAGARSLRSAMEAAARAIAAVTPTRAARTRLAALLVPATAQTRDVAVLLARPGAAAPTPAVRAILSELVRSARAQEAFLLAVTAGARAPTRAAARRALARARRAADLAAALDTHLTLLPTAGLAGLLPAAALFDVQPLERAVG